jgi:threonine/homoserine/homoserine lactone efflux protein
MMLPLDTALALVSFAFVAAMTPGPNNIMLTASGVTFGFTRTIPHMLGICAGFVALVLAVGLGVGAAFTALPEAKTVLKIIGAAYMLWLAWKVATAGPSDADGGRAAPMTFWQAVAFQWVNPKAWVMAVSAMAASGRDLGRLRPADVAAVTIVFGLVTVSPSWRCCLWPALRRWSRTD